MSEVLQAIMKILTIMVLLPIWVNTFNMTGYDCSNPDTSYTSISTHGVEECSSDSLKTEKQDRPVFLVYKNDFAYNMIRECTLTRSVLITRCGVWSHAIAVNGGFRIQDPVTLTAEECDVMHRKGLYITNTGRKIKNLQINEILRFHEVDVGALDQEGACVGGSVTTNGQTFTNVVRQVYYSLTIKEAIATYVYDMKKLVTREGYRLSYDARTALLGSTRYVWDTNIETSSCHGSRYTILYDGMASYYKSNLGTDFYVVDNSEFSFAIIGTTITYVCNLPIRKTGNSRVYLVDDVNAMSGARAMTHRLPAPIDLDLIMELKLFYIEENVRNRTTELYQTIYKELCDKNLLYMRSLLSLAKTHPEEFAWSYTKMSGYTAILRGEVIYLKSC